MGGPGSTRWGWYAKKTPVEECYRLTISLFKQHLQPWQSGKITWSQGGLESGNISYFIEGDETTSVMRLVYTIGAKSGHPVDYDYPVQLTTSKLAWGKLRYWFICPAFGCGRRVGCLYLPAGGKYFACRHCYHLSYQARQEGYQKWAYWQHLLKQIGES